jgi:TolB-like protein
VSEPTPQAGEGLWAVLRRRKVVQWGIAYAAAAWGFLQGLAYLSTLFHWPEQLQRLVTVAFLVGLPIALVLAWYHGDRGHQKVSGSEFTILTVLLMLGGGLFWWVGRMPETRVVAAAAPAAAQAPAAAGARASIAVLPFVNMSGDKGNEYFADGISEELLNVLVRVDGLGVASRTSSFGYKGSPLGTAAIASALKVNHILEGSVRKSGNHVRITAQLIDAVNDRHLWSETYDRELTDIFAIQEEIANAIVAALRGQLGTAEAAAAVTVRADTENLEAYQLYLKARELFIARKDLKESVRLFEQVTELDPKFARGWEGLAAVCAVVESWGIRDRDYTAQAEQAANRALELDPSLSMPWAVLGYVARSQMPVDWARSLELTDRAIAADMHNSTAFLWRSIDWLELGFFERAVADLDHCLAQDPGYQNCTRWKALALLFAGRTDQAMLLFEKGVAAGFVVNRAESFIAPLLQRGDRVGALLLLKELGASPQLSAILLESRVKTGAPRPAADEVVRRHLPEQGDPYDLRMGAVKTYLWLGAYDQVGTAASLRVDALPQWEPGFPRFRNSPGFKMVLERLGVPSYWREHGYPPQCRAIGDRDFICE